MPIGAGGIGVGGLAGLGQGGASMLGNLAILAGAAGDGGRDERRRIIALANALQTPEFDMRALAAPEYTQAAEYSPSVYEAIINEDPSLVPISGDMRDQQLAALRDIARVSEEGLPLAERLRADELQREVGRESQRAQQSVLRELAERGRLSGGDELAARINANQQATELARGFGSDLAQGADLRRLQAMYGLADMAGGIRGQDFSEGATNAGIMNRFNEWASNLMTQAARDNAQSQQAAQFANTGRAQQVSDANQAADYEAALSNLNRQNQLRQTGFGNDLSKFGAQSGALQNYALYKDAEQAARAQTLRSIGGSGGGGSAGGGNAFQGRGYF